MSLGCGYPVMLMRSHRYINVYTSDFDVLIGLMYQLYQPARARGPNRLVGVPEALAGLYGPMSGCHRTWLEEAVIRRVLEG
eukprot:334500-Prymnesium_polylepis.1